MVKNCLNCFQEVKRSVRSDVRFGYSRRFDISAACPLFTVLSLMDLLAKDRALLPVDANRLKRSLRLLFGFLLGCIVAACGVAELGDWAWSFPVALAAVAIAMP
jgi:hypothetical protein